MISSILLVAGCEALPFDPWPDPVCEDRLVVDPETAAVRWVPDRSDCASDGAIPNGVQYALLLDDDYEPMFGANARVCNTASRTALQVDQLSRAELDFDPFASPLPGRVQYDAPADFVVGAWMEASYWKGNESRLTWSAKFRLGEPGSVADCGR